ncbi:hypothetical protein ACVWYG_001149 [Pedobacter sp. UYEF25]
MKVTTNNSLTKKTVFIYRNIKTANDFKTDPTLDPSTATVKTILSSMAIMFQK